MLRLLLLPFFLLITIDASALDHQDCEVKTKHAAAQSKDERVVKLREKVAEVFNRYKAEFGDNGSVPSKGIEETEFGMWMRDHYTDQIQLEAGIERWSKENKIYGEIIQLRIEEIKLGGKITDEFKKWVEAQEGSIDGLEKGISYWEQRVPGLRVAIEELIKVEQERKKYKEKIEKWDSGPYSETPSRIYDIVYTPIDAVNPELQRQNEIKELREIIQSGYRISDDPRPIRHNLHIYKVVECNKLYLIPSLKELGTSPVDVRPCCLGESLVDFRSWYERDADPLFILLRKLIRDKQTAAFNAVLDCYQISDDQFDEFIKWAGVFDHTEIGDLSSFVSDFLKHVVPVIPVSLVNNCYSLGSKAYPCDPQTLLQYSVERIEQQYPRDAQDFFRAHGRMAEEDAPCDLSLIRQLLAKDADPLLADLFKYGMLAYSKTYFFSASKKQIRWLLFPLAVGLADCRKQLITATLDSFPPELSELCADYNFEMRDDRLLETIGEGNKEEEVLEGITAAFNNVPECYHESLVNGYDEQGRTPLMYAASKNYVNVMRMLYNKGGNLGVIDCRGKHTLHHVNQHFHFDQEKVRAAVAFICEQAKEGNQDIVSIVNKVPTFGCAPLVEAVHYRHPKVVRLLVENRANPLIASDGPGRNVLDIASEFEDKTILEELQKYKAESSAKFSDYPFAVPEACERKE
ncbi:MAG: hypothetical protein ACHQVS_04915 [Candidatus Babeliales bacterium]